MADISVRGYVNKPKTIDGAKGPFSAFTLSESQKNKDGSKTKVYYNVTDFKNPTPPVESSFVTVSGWFKVRKAEDGKQYMDIIAQELEVAPPRDAASVAAKEDDDFGF